MPERVMITVNTPPDSVESVLDAISAAGGGIIGEYTHCAFTSSGSGHFKPSEAANPSAGQKNVINSEPEVRIETFCERTIAKAVVQAIKGAHPYEEPVVYIIPLLDEADL